MAPVQRGGGKGGREGRELEGTVGGRKRDAVKREGGQNFRVVRVWIEEKDAGPNDAAKNDFFKIGAI